MKSKSTFSEEIRAHTFAAIDASFERKENKWYRERKEDSTKRERDRDRRVRE